MKQSRWTIAQAARSPDGCGAGGDRLRGSLPCRGGRCGGVWIGCGGAWFCCAARAAGGAVRGSAARARPAGPARAGGAGASGQRGSGQAGPPRRVCCAGRQPGRPGRQPEDGYRLCADPVPTSFCTSTRPGMSWTSSTPRSATRRSFRVAGWWPRARVGSSPLAAAIDQRTDTVYVINGTEQHRLGAEWRPVQRPGDPRLRPAGGDGQGREVPGRRGRQPGDAHAVCGEPRRGQRLGDQRGQVQRQDHARVRAAGPDGEGQGRPGLARCRQRDRHRLRGEQRPSATATPCR